MAVPPRGVPVDDASGSDAVTQAVIDCVESWSELVADGDTEQDAEGDDLSLEDVTSMLEERVGRRRDTYFTMHANRVVQRYDELVALKPEERSARVAAAQERLLLEGWSSD